MKTLYFIIGCATIALYGAAGALGLEMGGAERAEIPAEVRRSPGGYRSYHFWHTGFFWGK